MAKSLKQKIKSFISNKWFKRFIFCSFILLLIVGILLFRYVHPFYKRAHNYDLSKIDNVEHPSIIFDRNGREIGRIFVENRSVISIDKMPQLLIDSVIAQEDQRFWENRGVDEKGLLRMVKENIMAGEVTQGASTITMQLARNAFDLKNEALERNESGVERKIVEIFLAYRIGKKYSSESGKKFILENYLNRVPFGHGYYGVRSASLGYFGKEPEDLNWEEAASMVSCIKNPSYFSPLRFPEHNKKARDHVFKRLMIDEKIDQKEYDRLCKLPIKTSPKPLRRGTSHLYEKVGEIARDIIGEDAMAEGGYRIHTTIDYNLQTLAEKSIKERLNEIEQEPDYTHSKYEEYDPKKGPPDYLQGGILINDPKTGKVLAHVGGRDYNHTQFDFVNLGKRPLGTAVLPFIYSLGLEEGYRLCDTLLDEAIDNRLLMVGGREGIPGEWGAESAEPIYEGEISLRDALLDSKIAASLRLGKTIGLPKFATFAEDLGMDFPEQDDLLARDLLGWVPASILEASKAYSAIANKGRSPRKHYYITKIERSDGLHIYRASDLEMRENPVPVMSESTSYQIDTVLREIPEDGNLKSMGAEIKDSGFQGGVKTGTPYNFEDAWAFAYNEHLVISSWVGFQKGNRGEILPEGFSKKVIMPMISSLISGLPESLKESKPEMPAGMVKKEICKVSGLLATRYCFQETVMEHNHDHDHVSEAPSEEEGAEEGKAYISTAYYEYFKEGRAPVEICSTHMGLDGEKSFVDAFAPVKGITAARPVLAVNPIKPSSPVVIGTDPYGAVENSATEAEVNAFEGVYANTLLILNDEVPGEEEAAIVLPKPNRLRLKVNPEDLKPQVSRAVVVED